MQKKILVAVYGTLRDGFGNHSAFLEESMYLGTWETPAKYTMYNLSAYPGVVKGGNTSIVMEVYSITEKTLQELDYLEGYSKNGRNNLYNRETIDSPFGKCFTYFYNHSIKGKSIVESGDWTQVKFMNLKNLINA